MYLPRILPVGYRPEGYLPSGTAAAPSGGNLAISEPVPSVDAVRAQTGRGSTRSARTDRVQVSAMRDTRITKKAGQA